MVEQPPPRSPPRPLGVGLILAACILALAGAFTTALPTAAGTALSLGVAAIVALWTAWSARPGGALSGSTATTTARARWTRNPWLRVPGFALMMGLFAYNGVACGAIAIAAAVVGQPTSRALAISATDTTGQWQLCTHFDVREAPMLFDRALCAPPSVLQQASPGQILTVYGRGFALGMNVERYQVQPPAP